MTFDSRNHKAFFKDINEHGFHIFSRRHAKVPGFYPNAFPAFPEIDISDLNEDDTITVRAFFRIGKSSTPRVDSGQMDLQVKRVDRDAKRILGEILTELPPMFVLSKGASIELGLDEVLSARKSPG